VEKITFVRHPYNARLGKSSPLTYQFHDTYITNGVAIHQILERTVREPDILFSAKFLPVEAPMYEGTMYERTGTSNWWSGAAGSANPNRTGPGIIRPPIKIAFKKTGRAFLTDDGPGSGVDFSFRIASFSSTASPIISYPQAAGHLDTNHLTINLWIESNYAENGVFNKQDFTWRLPIGIGKLAAAQASTNLVDWDTLFTVVNQGEPLLWYHLRTTPVRFLRVVAQ
jgi:hypothetical protein